MNSWRIFLTIVSVAAIAAASVAYAAEPAYPVLGEVQQRMSKAVDGHALESLLRLLPPEGQNNLSIDTVMAGYSTALGGQLAIAAYDKDAYCASAAGLREELKGDAEGKLAIWKTTD